MAESYPKIAQLKTVEAFRTRLQELALDLPVDDQILTAEQGSPLAAPIQIGGFRVGNRWCVHPMEGWDANRDGSPSPHTLRRWRHFGLSGAKLIWGGEAAAVQGDGRANPNQTLATPENRAGLAALLRELTAAHRQHFGTTDDLLIGLQLTHSGRFCRPHSKQLEPRIAYHHPLLDAKFGIAPQDDSVVWTDDDLERLIDTYVAAAGLAQEVGFQFVDVKACHGYLLHEFLSARVRPGRFGGDFDGRTRILRTIVARLRNVYPDLLVGVRLSAFDIPPFKTSREVGQPMRYEDLLPYQYGFGCREDNPLEYDLTEPLRLIGVLRELGVAAINLTCGSPYYNPHIQRPAIFPPSDGYQPPEDPLVGVARQIRAARSCQQAFPDLPMVGTGYTYLQDYLPHVAQAVVRAGWINLVGIGRMVLAYPEMPADALQRGQLQRKRICRTFSDCTTGPRHGLVSGCYPLDDYYKQLPEAETLKSVKQAIKAE
ncbi:MAG TPA: NADH:flavin oxidoreductase [Candidatus Anammoximicrobium sp.]|nr:NADH:flavin oxidoreductase [Candidatus Anammoximicrobium sp.]